MVLVGMETPIQVSVTTKNRTMQILQDVDIY